MNNPGVDVANWERLREKWASLQSAGHKVKVNFYLISDSEDKNKILAIDVVQTVDEDVFTETVQRNAGEGAAAIGIAGLSMERLVKLYKEKLDQIYLQAKKHEAKVVVTMSASSPLSGEVTGYIEIPDSNTQNGLSLRYQHYYILNAIREKMVELVGDRWQTVKAVYQPYQLELHFEYNAGRI